MTLQYGAALSDAQLNAIAETVGASAKLRIYEGLLPNDCEAQPEGSLLVEFDLPEKWLGAAEGGVVVKVGTWAAIATGSGVAGFWRIYDAAGKTCHLQGDVGDDSGQIVFDNPVLKKNQTIRLDDFAIDAGNL